MAPLITATETQAAFASVHNVNLLAANIGNGWFSSGSGIYSGKRVLKSYFNMTLGDSEMLIADVTEPVFVATSQPVPPAASFDSGNLPAGAVVVPFSVQTRGAVSATTTGGLNCSLHYFRLYARLSKGDESDRVGRPSSSGVYALIAFRGNYNGLFEADICALVACADNNSSQCGQNTFTGTVVFRDVLLCGDEMQSGMLHVCALSATYRRRHCSVRDVSPCWILGRGRDGPARIPAYLQR